MSQQWVNRGAVPFSSSQHLPRPARALSVQANHFAMFLAAAKYCTEDHSGMESSSNYLTSQNRACCCALLASSRSLLTHKISAPNRSRDTTHRCATIWGKRYTLVKGRPSVQVKEMWWENRFSRNRWEFHSHPITLTPHHASLLITSPYTSVHPIMDLWSVGLYLSSRVYQKGCCVFTSWVHAENVGVKWQILLQEREKMWEKNL